jgi:AbrB family looped-hinge helix DNA binding protein
MTSSPSGPRATTYKMGPKGQVVIPKSIRERLHLKPGDRLSVYEESQEVRIRKALADPAERRAVLDRLRGVLAGGPSLTGGLEAERRRERAHEDRPGTSG